jgi:hypothetical protein
MTGLLSGLFGPSDPSADSGASIFANPNFQSLAALAGALGQGAMPSPVKIPFGAILGQAAAAAAGGANNANTYQQGQNQATAGKLQNELSAAQVPLQINMLKQMYGMMGGGTVPGSLAGPQPAGTMPGVQNPVGPGQQPGVQNPVDAGGNPIISPAMAARYAQLAAVGNDPRSAQGWLTYLQNYTPQRGTYVDQDGNVQVSPGATDAVTALNYSGQLGTDTANVQTAGPEEAAKDAAGAPYKVETWTAKGPDGQYHTYTGTKAQFLAANGGAPGAGGVTGGSGGASPTGPLGGAFASIPAQMQQPAMMAAIAAGLPAAAIPAWVSAVQNESGWNPNAGPGKAGEIGIGQVKPTTAQGMGIDPATLNTPQGNLIASARYFAKGWQQSGGDPARALAFYNTGDPTNPDTAYVAPAMQRLAAWSGQGAPAPSQPGVEGAPDMTPEQEGISKEYGEQAGQIIAAANAAPVIKAKLLDLQTAAAQFRPGASGDLRAKGIAWLSDAYQGLGLPVPADVANGTASATEINKIGAGLALDLARTMGSREAAQIVMLTKSINPSIDFSTGGFQRVTALLGQQAQYAQDLGTFQNQWLTSHSSIAGMMDAFQKQNPPEVYASRVEPLQMPASQASALPNVIYQTPRGPLMWTGQGFAPVPQQ